MNERYPPRERAARALCASGGMSENSMIEGRPIWESFLPVVDTVLKAALTPKEWMRIREEDGSHD